MQALRPLEQAALPYVDYRTSTYRPPPPLPYRRGAANTPPLAHFILLSMLFHALVVLMFGAPSGGSREGRAMWGTLQVVLQGAAPEPPPSLKLDRGLAPRKPAPATRAKPAATPPPRAEPPPPPPREAPFAFPPLLDRLVAPELKPLQAPPPLRVPLPTETPYVPRPLPEPTVTPEAAEPVSVAPAPAPDATTPPVARPPVETVAIPVPATPPVERPPVEAPIVPVPAVPSAAPPVERPPVEVPALPIPTAPSAPPPRVEPVATPPERAITPEVPVTPTPPPAVERAPPPPPVERAPPPPPVESPAPRPPEVEPPRRVAPEPSLPSPPAPSASPFTAPSPGISRDDRKEAPATGYDPTAPALDLDAVRRRAGQIAREGSGRRAVLPFPMPPVPERKSKEAIAIEKARKPDCRTAYQELGLAAVVPLIANQFGEGTCRW